MQTILQERVWIWLKINWFRIALGFFFCATALLCGFGLLSPLSSWFNGGHLSQNNETFIITEQQALSKDLALVMAILGTVNVVESLDVGFNFLISAQIGVGNTLNGFAIILERAVETILATIITLEFLAIMLRSSAELAGIGFTLTAFSVGMALMFNTMPNARRVRSITSKIAQLVTACFFVLYLVLPYSVQTVAWLSAKNGHLTYHTARSGLDALHEDLVVRPSKTPTIKQWTEHGTAPAVYNHVTKNLHLKIEAGAHLIWKYSAHMIVYFLILPALFSLLGFFIIHRSMKYIFHPFR